MSRIPTSSNPPSEFPTRKLPSMHSLPVGSTTTQWIDAEIAVKRRSPICSMVHTISQWNDPQQGSKRLRWSSAGKHLVSHRDQRRRPAPPYRLEWPGHSPRSSSSAQMGSRWSLTGNYEIFITNYEILLEHALGNNADILQERSHLCRSHGHASLHLRRQPQGIEYTASQRPDENYAREVKQLFTIGLWELNPRRQETSNSTPTERPSRPTTTETSRPSPASSPGSTPTGTAPPPCRPMNRLTIPISKKSSSMTSPHYPRAKPPSKISPKLSTFSSITQTRLLK